MEEEEGQELSTELGVSVDSAQTRRISPEDTREPQSPAQEKVQVTQDLSPPGRLLKSKSVNQVPGWEGWEAQQAGTELGSPSPAFMAGESFQEVWPVRQPFCWYTTVPENFS